MGAWKVRWRMCIRINWLNSSQKGVWVLQKWVFALFWESFKRVRVVFWKMLLAAGWAMNLRTVRIKATKEPFMGTRQKALSVWTRVVNNEGGMWRWMREISQVWMEYQGITVGCRMGDVGLQLGKEIRVRKRLEAICIELLVSGSYKIEPDTKWARGEWTRNFVKERSFRKACIDGDDWRRTGDKCRGGIVRDRREWGACVLETTGEGFKEHPMALDVVRWWMMWNAKKIISAWTSSLDT